MKLKGTRSIWELLLVGGLRSRNHLLELWASLSLIAFRKCVLASDSFGPERLAWCMRRHRPEFKLTWLPGPALLLITGGALGEHLNSSKSPSKHL